MKNTIILLIFSLLYISESFPQGKLITIENAESLAEKFYFERIRSHQDISGDEIKPVNNHVIQENGQVLYYIFNFASGGFVAVSAYDATWPVLCYSFSGEFNPLDQPASCQAWMGQYSRQIAHAIDSKASPDDEISAAWKHYLETPLNSIQPFAGREVLPMLTSTWDQGTYYNAMCPEDPAGPAGHCVTGCVATALGQLLNYFRWPESGTGSYSYECPPYGTLSADFSSAGYEWDLMQNNLNNSNPEIAEIIYHLGVSVDMVYGPDGSGMYNHKAAYTLKTYFKYSPETRYVFRDSTSMDWDSLLVAHLDQHIPLYYAGWSVPDTMGHAFICDGYQGENFYHFNWGWSGSNDGYYYTENLTPGGNNFNLAQELVINAVPDTNLYTYPVQCGGLKEYETLYGTLDDGSGPLYGYSSEADCSWLITPNDSVTSITLNFHRFETGSGDYLTVYDGSDTTAPVLGIFSGEELPAGVTSTGGSIFIHFNSDSDTSGDGFLASFESEVPVFCSGMAMMNAQTDTLSDGSGTWHYHDNSACLWRIMPEGATSVTLYFTEFETEAGYDLVKIYDLQNQQLLAEYSGTYEPGVPDPVTSPSGKMFISFNTNSINTAAGWTAYYESDLVKIDEAAAGMDLIIYPNPSNDYLNIRFRNQTGFHAKIALSDIAGRRVYESGSGLEGLIDLHIDLSLLSPGIYILDATLDNGKAEYHKIIKN